jgi:hypothetical protein
MTKDQIGKVKKNQVVTKCCCLFNFFLLISLWFTTDKMNKLLEIQACSISFLTNRLFSLTRIELNDPLKSGGAMATPTPTSLNPGIAELGGADNAHKLPLPPPKIFRPSAIPATSYVIAFCVNLRKSYPVT